MPMKKGLRMMGAVLLAAVLPRMAEAALGEPETTAAEDSRQLRGSIKASDRANYRVHEITLPAGTVLREFAIPGGNVFAVSWSGPVVPNLRQALGRYFANYVNSAQDKPGGRRHFAVNGSDFVLHSSGRMRAFSGQAYLPQALPAGVLLDELR